MADNISKKLESLNKQTKTSTSPIFDNQQIFCQDGYSLTKLWYWNVESIYPLSKVKGNELLQVLTEGETFNVSGYSTLITTQGERLFADDFDYLSETDSFDYRLEKYIKISKPNEQYGLLDTKGNQILDTIYEILGTPSDNQVNGQRNGQKYTIDLTTLQETPIKNGKDYQRLGCFSEGLCKVSTIPRMDNWEDEDNRLAYHSDFEEIAGCWGFINRQGEEIVAPQFIYANDFEDGIAIVCKGKWYKDPKWNNQYNQGRYWSDTELWGAIDTEGNVAIPFIFDEIEFFTNLSSEQYCINAFKAHIGGWKEGHWGVIDKNGNWLAEPIFEDLGYYFDNGVFEFYDRNKWDDEALIGLYDINQQKVIFEPKYSDVDLNGDGTFNIEYTDEQGNTVKQTLYFDGSIVPTKTYDYHYTPSYIEITDSNIVKQDNTILIKHERLAENSDYFKIIEHDKKWGLCTRFGQIVLPIEYQSMFLCQDKYLICQHDERWFCFEMGKE